MSCSGGEFCCRLGSNFSSRLGCGSSSGFSCSLSCRFNYRLGCEFDGGPRFFRRFSYRFIPLPKVNICLLGRQVSRYSYVRK